MSAQGGMVLLLNGCASSLIKATSDSSNAIAAGDFVRNFGPIDRTLPDSIPNKFSGDNDERPHRILRNLPQYLAAKSVESTEKAPVVIIGGGMSGLFTAYGLRKHRPILIEQAPRFGGNAKGESWRGLSYSIGAAYIDLPRPGIPMHSLYEELGLEEILVGRPGSDPVEYDGKLYSDFWSGETEPEFKNQYAKLNQFLSDVMNEKERPFPFIPALNPEQMSSVKYYDQWSLHELVTRVIGGKIPPHLDTLLEYYCWSTYAASTKELSAAGALNFLAQESNIRIGAGGNARIAERVLERVLKEVPKENLRPSSLGVQVKVEQDHVKVLYEDSAGKLRQIKTRCVVMACPQFIAAKMLDGIEAERLSAIKKLSYRSYMTAHVLFKKAPQQNFYDIFMIGGKNNRVDDIRVSQDRTNATDFIIANFAEKNNDAGVLTFYRAFPFDGARPQLNQPGVFADYKNRFEKQIAKQVLPLLKLSPSDVVDIRMTLWGHAVPVPAKGLFSDGTIDQLRKPFRESVFFIEQDSWAFPSIQTGATESVLLRDQINKILG